MGELRPGSSENAAAVEAVGWGMVLTYFCPAMRRQKCRDAFLKTTRE